MKFKMRVKRIDGQHGDWWETYDKPGTDAKKMALEIIDFYNSTLRPGETAREIIEVVALDQLEDSSTHQWEKWGIVTVVSKATAAHDTYKCKVCGITGKRFGLSSTIKIDSKFRAKLFLDCRRAKQKLLEAQSA